MKRNFWRHFAPRERTGVDRARWRRPTDRLSAGYFSRVSRRVWIALNDAVGACSDVILHSSRV